MPRSAVAAPRTEAVDEVVMAAVAVKRRAVETMRLTLKALREFDEAINQLAGARDREGDHA